MTSQVSMVRCALHPDLRWSIAGEHDYIYCDFGHHRDLNPQCVLRSNIAQLLRHGSVRDVDVSLRTAIVGA